MIDSTLLSKASLLYSGSYENSSVYSEILKSRSELFLPLSLSRNFPIMSQTASHPPAATFAMRQQSAKNPIQATFFFCFLDKENLRFLAFSYLNLCQCNDNLFLNYIIFYFTLEKAMKPLFRRSEKCI